jgi:hypothetical protein
MNQADNGYLRALIVGGLRIADKMNTEKQQCDYQKIESWHNVESPLFWFGAYRI